MNEIRNVVGSSIKKYDIKKGEQNKYLMNVIEAYEFGKNLTQKLR